MKSTKHFFILRDFECLKNCTEYLKNLFSYANGKIFEVHVKEYRKNRSNAQNRTLWMWLNTISKDTGYTPDELHENFKVQFLGTVEKVVEGVTLVYPKSTTGLSTKEFAEYLGKIELVAAQLDIKLPYPDDINYAIKEE